VHRKTPNIHRIGALRRQAKRARATAFRDIR
jgi:hypothetical protein